MKAIKYFVIGAMLAGMSAPAMAQVDKAQVDAITKVVIDAKGDVKATKDQVKDYIKLNKKNADAIAALGRAFLNAKNLEQAKLYADQAIKVGKNNAAGYILHGDISAVEENGGEAAMWYETATTVDPKNPTSYVKYARVYQKVDPDGAVAMLKKLGEVDPTYPVDAAAGYMFSQNDRLKTALEYFDKVKDVTTLEDYILFDYASTAYVMEQYDKAVNLASKGIAKYPTYNAFNRIGMYASDKKKDYETAANYGAKLFATNDTVKFTANDYIFYGDALTNTGKYDEAVAAYNHIAEVAPENKEAKKLISATLVKAKKFAEAVTALEGYIADKGQDVTYKEYDALADIYIDEADAATDNAAKVEAYKKADKVYATIAEKFDYAATYAVWKRALMNHQINPDLKVGFALPYYQQYISLVEPKADKSAAELNKLATAYTYLAVHYIQNDKKAEAKEFAGKLLEIKPEDPNGLQIMNIK